MNEQEVLNFSWVEQRYRGILEIYPHRATNSFVLNSALEVLAKKYDLVKITSGWIRAFEK